MLMSKINELTVYRESNATLRADSEAKGRRVAELDAKLKQVTDELAPAKQELLVLRAEGEARDSQITRLTQDNRRWQERNQQLLTKVRCHSHPFAFDVSYDCSMNASTLRNSKR
jgi:nucleoprotein TPR